ncbi:carboxylesterase/lipase family protein [Flavisolibacter nicotianae]|uniref:carboxylesterase/lipase family protein n=1 Tax=Flavisolibacter nicotianae TaxID=2364882 RepID=UPI000EB53140|nr:carboxylesterase family protein [Flavisolibacter nicotianae]
MKRPIFLSIGLLGLAFGALAQAKNKTAAAASGNQSLQVRTVSGIVEGRLEASGVRSFKGIPYAAPPVDNLRWREPQPVKSWTGVHKADHFGPRAMQTAIFGDMNFRSDGVGENCLYLNVWAPSQKTKTLLPVLVYFYGGGFVAGDGSEPRYDGESMAQKGIVTLTVNYRLGLFGFFSHPELTKESPHHASGNYGLLDQAAALQWVRKNIAAFGGDPNHVTIAGESAGSVSVSAQMASPLAKNLIAGAIGESGSLLGTLSPAPLSECEKTGEEFARSIGAHSLAELRSISADSLLGASARFGLFRFRLSVDGYFLPKDPLEIFQKGEQAHVPLLVGWNSEEMNYRALMGGDKPTKENYEKAVRKVYTDKADDVLKVYKPATDDEVEAVATALAGDRFIGFSTWRWADLQGTTGGKPVYRYLYERPRPPMTPEMGNASPGLAGGVQRGNTPPPPPAKGAVHSAEIEYAMGNLSTNKVFAWTEDDYKVSRTMQEYFANFIRKGDPNGPGVLNWPAANRSKDVPVMHINVQSRVELEKNRERYLLLQAAAKN